MRPQLLPGSTMRPPLLLSVIFGLTASCGGEPAYYWGHDGSGASESDGSGADVDAADVGDSDAEGADGGETDLRPDAVDPGCTSADDCAGGETCIAGQCYTPCTSDDGCAEPTPVCALDAGVCVECVVSDGCALGEICVDAECVMGCETSDDCTGAQTCVDGACRGAEPICAPSTSRCSAAGDVLICAPDGLSETVVDCGAGTCAPASASTAECVEDTTCEPFSSGCEDSSTRWSCSSDGMSRALETCPSGRCEDGVCIPAGDVCVSAWPTTVEFGDIAISGFAEHGIELSSCGTATPVVTGMSFSGSAFSHGWPGPSTPLTSPLFVPIYFQPLTAGSFTDTLEVGVEGADTLFIPVSGRGVSETADCPTAVAGCRVSGSGSYTPELTTPIGSTIQCSGSGSFGDVAITGYSWGLTPPWLSGAVLTSAARETTSFTPDLEGTYTLSLTVTDAEGTVSCTPSFAEVSISAETVSGVPLHVQVTWDAASDVDLHVAEGVTPAWGSDDDCHYGTTEADWGVHGVTADDGIFGVDDTNGFGPEDVTVAQTASGNYTVGVLLQPTTSSVTSPASTVTATVTWDGAVVSTRTRRLTAGQFWVPVEIEVIDGDASVGVIDTVRTGIP